MSEKTFKIVGNDLSDGYHTFDELYDHRCLLFLAWMHSDGCPGPVYWVRDHFEGWDLVVCTWSNGEQMSYHVPTCYRDITQDFTEKPAADHVWDGHTPEDVADRIRARLRAF